MRVMSTILLVLAMLAGQYAGADSLEFDFFDPDGRKFSSRDMDRQFTDASGAPVPLQVLLIYSPTLAAADLRRQWELLAMNPRAAEELGVLYVTACAEAEDRHGYYTAPSMAMSLVVDPSRFSATLLRPDGEVLRRWLEPVSTEELAGQLLMSGTTGAGATP